MKRIADTAYVVSVHDDAQGILRINLKWQGTNDISAFDLDRLGKVVHCETETQNTGWVIIEPYNRLNIHPEALLPEELLPGFASAILEPSSLINTGDTVPLRETVLVESKRAIDLACFLHCVTLCAKERRLEPIARCFLEELAKYWRGSSPAADQKH